MTARCNGTNAMGHVLYAQDDDDMRRDWAFGLRTLRGHTVITAATAAEALFCCADRERPLSAVIINLYRSYNGGGIALAGAFARVLPDAAVTVYSGGIRTLPPDIPDNVRLLRKPMGFAAFLDMAGDTAEDVRLSPRRSW